MHTCTNRCRTRARSRGGLVRVEIDFKYLEDVYFVGTIKAIKRKTCEVKDLNAIDDRHKSSRQKKWADSATNTPARDEHK